MKKTYIMILAGLAIAGASTTYCFSQSKQEVAVATPAPAVATPAAPAAEAAVAAEAAPAPEVPATPALAEAEAALAAADAPVTPSTISDEDAKKAFSYFIGYRFGLEVSSGASTLSADDFDKEIFFQAMEDSLSGKQPSMDQATIEAGMNAFVATMQKREAVKAEANLAAGKAYQEEYAKGENVVKTDSGLLYKVITPGTGSKYDPAVHGAGAICNVMYEGKLIDGTVFDKSPSPIDMPIDRVVPGFSEALQLMPEGSTWEVCIPSDLAYGPQGPAPIGNNSTLVFTITLNSITKAPTAEANSQSLQQLPPEILQQLQAQGLEVMPEDAAAEDIEELPAPAAETAPAPEAAPAVEAPAPAAETPAPAVIAPAESF